MTDAVGENLAQIPRIKTDTLVQKVGDTWVAVGSDETLHLFKDEGGPSEVGGRIVELIDGRRSVEQIVDTLCEEFEVPREQCASDTLKFIGVLIGKNILVVS
ncbi:MAG: PqqD family protein [Myxococcaceae bacterium]|nr:PqqD family protein [Myxococcaceae bacterium]